MSATLNGWTEIPLPPSANRIYRKFRNRMVATAEYREWMRAAADCLRHTPKQTASVMVSVQILGGKGWIESSDLDNCIKAIGDLLQPTAFEGRQHGAGIIPSDDCRTIRAWFVTYVDRDGHAALTKTKKKDLQAECLIKIDPIGRPG